LTHIAEGLLKRAVLELPLNEPAVAAEHYLGLNAEQVQAAFAKWVHPADLVAHSGAGCQINRTNHL
jgi:zinc protease